MLEASVYCLDQNITQQECLGLATEDCVTIAPFCCVSPWSHLRRKQGRDYEPPRTLQPYNM